LSAKPNPYHRIGNGDGPASQRKRGVVSWRRQQKHTHSQNAGNDIGARERDKRKQESDDSVRAMASSLYWKSGSRQAASEG
jgi:hypothetical protein